jgi:hypothetical protein
MFCCPHCSQLSTTLNNIVTPDSGSTILFNIVDKCEQRGHWAAKHCSILLNRGLSVFTRVAVAMELAVSTFSINFVDIFQLLKRLFFVGPHYIVYKLHSL